MKNSHLGRLSLAMSALLCATASYAAIEDHGAGMTVSQSVRHDTSPPLTELIRIVQQRRAADPDNVEAPDHVYPNFTEIQNTGTNLDRTLIDGDAPLRQTQQFGSSAPPLDQSFDGIGQNDAPGGGLPPDTNGDIGPDHYIMYINTDWQIYNKATGLPTTPVMEGNTFWAGFTGPCETSNSGDPIVLYDKLADRWMFSQFTGTATNRQCFAVSTTSDPMGPYNRYEFDFTPEFNDYPHISVWTDASGARSGYYLTTHDFLAVGGNFNFQQASFSVVERDVMIAGGPVARIVRFTNTGFAGASSFGALSAHLESSELPPAGMCAPFVHNRADLDGYLVWQMCVDWTNVNNSTLSSPSLLPAGVVIDNNVARVPQPAPAPPGSELDEFAGNTMYRASARAYPAASGLPVELVLNHVTNAGGGQAGVRWVHLSLPNNDELFAGGFETSEPLPAGQERILDQGVFAPDNTFRWMAGISLDQSGNIGVGYSASSTTVMPSVRYTGRQPGDAPNTLRGEQECVTGGGVQQFVDNTGRAGRWGDYASMSIDPDDQCTFWLASEYYAVTGTATWDNRICSFRFPDCGDPSFVIRSDFDTQMRVCALNDAPEANINAFALAGFTGSLNLSASSLPPGVTASFATNPVNSLPGGSTFTLQGLNGFGDGSFSFQVNASSAAPALTRTLGFNVNVSAGVVAAPLLTAPANSGQSSVRPTFTWGAVSGALEYRIEIATDAAFTNIIESATVDTNSYTISTILQSGASFFWRVTGMNNCGPGAASATSSFTTVAPGQCPAGTSPNVVYNDDLEGGAPGWTMPADPFGSGNTWALSNARQNSGQFSFFAVDSTTSSDQYLVSPSITVPPLSQQPLTLSFWNFQNMESNTGAGVDACWDGGLLEVSTDNGTTWTQVADGNLLTDPYNGDITINNASPISGQPAWCADMGNAASGALETTSIVDLSQYAGQSIRLRFRVGTDGSAGVEGWYIDDVQVQGCN